MLIEIIIIVALSSTLTLTALTHQSKSLTRQKARFTLRQIKAIINYARSEAIAKKALVTICPSSNQISCGGIWRNGILVQIDAIKIRYFALNLPDNVSLTLNHSGFAQQKVQLQPNGLTYTQGHFTYKSLNPRYIAGFNLYFNRAFKTYETLDD